jgi:murein DD-endopeptidase MepM/ murein hydrolase activator NlpD
MGAVGRTLTKVALLCVFALPASASATDGSAEAPAYGGAGAGELEPAEQSLDRSPASAVRKPKPKPRATGSGGHPLLTTFAVASSRLYIYGRAARVSFQVDDRSDTVAVRLAVVSAESGQTVRTIDLGAQTTGVAHSYRFTGREGGSALPAGRYRIRVRARDATGKALVRRARTSAVDEIAVYPYRFPLKGDFPFGDAGSRFGAPRSGHSHQGQDVAAPEGTQVRAARGGIVKVVAYQGSGAGHYIIIDGAGERRDYAYMHLQTGSIRVAQGQRVRTGAWIANVGNTGASFGAHLHFEIWRGSWYGGGKPIDPFPMLRRWDRWS